MWTTAERRTTISLSPPSVPRLVLEPTGSPGSLLDGGWWPRSRDPVAELPGLILAIDDRHGSPITQILLRTGDWDSRPRRLRVDGPTTSRMVRLGWFDMLPASLLIAICTSGQRVDLLVVPAHTPPAAARAAMQIAAEGGNRIPAPDILSAVTTPATPATPAHRTDTLTAAEAGWESEGGRLRDHLSEHAAAP